MHATKIDEIRYLGEAGDGRGLRGVGIWGRRFYLFIYFSLSSLSLSFPFFFLFFFTVFYLIISIIFIEKC